MSGAPMGIREIEAALRSHALGYSGAYEEFPWGERAIKVEGKVFVFMDTEPPEVVIVVKLPHSSELALELRFAEPTGYGLGKHGWVTVHIRPGPRPPLDVLKGWIEESYRTVAPRKLTQKLNARKLGKVRQNRPSRAVRARARRSRHA